jgi:hypothetical protein
MEQSLPFNLAMFLSVAGRGTTYFMQMVWYAAYEGNVACPAAPDTCCAPVPFYPEMQAARKRIQESHRGHCDLCGLLGLSDSHSACQTGAGGRT